MENHYKDENVWQTMTFGDKSWESHRWHNVPGRGEKDVSLLSNYCEFPSLCRDVSTARMHRTGQLDKKSRCCCGWLHIIQIIFQKIATHQQSNKQDTKSSIPLQCHKFLANLRSKINKLPTFWGKHGIICGDFNQGRFVLCGPQFRLQIWFQMRIDIGIGVGIWNCSWNFLNVGERDAGLCLGKSRQ